MPKRKCSEIDRNVGVRLKIARVSCGLTQEQVAQMLNINRTTYTKYETGVSEPSHELLGKIVELYGTDYNTILGGQRKERDVFDMTMPMFNLTKEEQRVISAYRTFSDDNKKKMNDLINAVLDEQSRRFQK